MLCVGLHFFQRTQVRFILLQGLLDPGGRIGYDDLHIDGTYFVPGPL
jgi:hypothetical protein